MRRDAGVYWKSLGCDLCRFRMKCNLSSFFKQLPVYDISTLHSLLKPANRECGNRLALSCTLCSLARSMPTELPFCCSRGWLRVRPKRREGEVGPTKRQALFLFHPPLCCCCVGVGNGSWRLRGPVYSPSRAIFSVRSDCAPSALLGDLLRIHCSPLATRAQ